MSVVESHLCVVEIGAYMVDCDVREMFLKFTLEPRLRLYNSVELTPSFPEYDTLETPVVHGCL